MRSGLQLRPIGLYSRPPSFRHQCDSIFQHDPSLAIIALYFEIDSLECTGDPSGQMSSDKFLLLSPLSALRAQLERHEHSEEKGRGVEWVAWGADTTRMVRLAAGSESSISVFGSKCAVAHFDFLGESGSDIFIFDILPAAKFRPSSHKNLEEAAKFFDLHLEDIPEEKQVFVAPARSACPFKVIHKKMQTRLSTLILPVVMLTDDGMVVFVRILFSMGSHVLHQ